MAPIQVISFDPVLDDNNPFLDFASALSRLRRQGERLGHHHIAAAVMTLSGNRS